MPLSKYAICGTKKSRFIKEQKESGLLCSLETKVPLRKIPLLDNICFKCNFIQLL